MKKAYIQPQIDHLQLTLLIYTFILHISIIILVFSNFSVKYTYELSILMFPIIYKLTLYRQILNPQVSYHESRYFDNHMRRIYDKIHRYQNEDQLYLLTIMALHLRHCSNSNLKCFCNKYFKKDKIIKKNVQWQKQPQNQQVEQQQQMTRKMFKKFYYDYIEDQYKLYLKAQSRSKRFYNYDSNFSYIYVLIQLIKTPSKAQFEALKLKQKKLRISIKDDLIINYIMKDSKSNFQQLISEENLLNQKLQISQLFHFEKSIEITKSNINNLIVQYKNWYLKILKDEIDLNEFLKKGNQILKGINEVEQQLFKLFETNPLSHQLEDLFYLFYIYVNLNSRRPREFQKNSKITFNFLKCEEKHIFDKNNAAVFISLVHPLGQLQQTSQSFRELCCIEKDRKNVNINELMPSYIGVQHNSFLQKFIQSGTINILKTENRFLLTKDLNGFIHPILARIKINPSYNFGASALVTTIQNGCQYILIDQNGIIQEVCESIFEHFFKKFLNFQLSQVIGGDSLLLMPQLTQLLSKQTTIEENISKFILVISSSEQYKNEFMKDASKQKSTYLMIRNSPYQTWEQKAKELMDFLWTIDFNTVSIFQVKMKSIQIASIQQLILLEIHSMKQIKGQGRAKFINQIVQSIQQIKSTEIPNDQKEDCDLKEDLYQLEDFYVTQKEDCIKNYKKKENQFFDFYLEENNFEEYAQKINNERRFTRRTTAKKLSLVDYYLEDMSDGGQRNNDGESESADSSDDEQNQGLNLALGDNASIGSTMQSGQFKQKSQVVKEILLSEENSSVIHNVIRSTNIVGIILLILYSINIIFSLMELENYQTIIDYQQRNTNLIRELNVFQRLSELQIIDNQEIIDYKPFQIELRQQYLASLENINKFQDIELIQNLYTDKVAITYGYDQKHQEYFSKFYVLNFLTFVINDIINKNKQGIVILIFSYNQQLFYLRSNFQQVQNFLQEVAIKSVDSLLHEINNNIKITIFIISILFIILSIIIYFPLYLMILQKKQFILTLFRSFKKEKMDSQLGLYNQLSQICTVDDNYTKQSLKKQYKSFRQQQMEQAMKNKKQSYIRTSLSLTRFGQAIAYFILFFCLITIYILLSFLFSQSNEQTLNVEIRENAHIQGLQMKLGYGLTLQISTYNILNTNPDDLVYLYQNQSECDYVYDILQNITMKTRQIMFNDKNQFIHNVVSKNACLLFDNKIQNQLTSKICRQVGEEILDKGVTLSLSYIQQQLQYFYDFCLISKLSNFIFRFNKLDQTDWVELIEENRLIQDQIIGLYQEYALKNILEYKYIEDKNLIQENFLLQIILFIFGIFTLLIMFLIAKYSYIITFIVRLYIKNNLAGQIREVKRLLLLIPIDLIVENALVMGYIYSEQKIQ